MSGSAQDGTGLEWTSERSVGHFSRPPRLTRSFWSLGWLYGPEKKVLPVDVATARQASDSISCVGCWTAALPIGLAPVKEDDIIWCGDVYLSF